MPFISYAQNSEDVMLWRAFRDVAAGFYVDVGAAHPDQDSVTRAFYDRGWRGINIEASPQQARRIAASRPRDVTLAVAAGATDGSVELHVLEETGLSTTDPDTVAMLRDVGREGRPLTVPMRRLDGILEQHAPGTVHFLKIDVEGAERVVIEGCDFIAHRPRVVLVEATKPMSTEQTHAEWEGLILAGGYRFTFFDGLNRFYVAEECFGELGALLSIPVNVLDDFVRVSDAAWAERAAAAATRAAAAEENARQAYGRGFLHAAEAGVLRVRNEVAEADRAEAVKRWLKADAWGHECDARTAATEAQLAAAEATAAAARTETAALATRLADAEAQRARSADALDAARQSITRLEGSTSWRMTRPLRAAVSAFRGGAQTTDHAAAPPPAPPQTPPPAPAPASRPESRSRPPRSPEPPPACAASEVDEPAPPPRPIAPPAPLRRTVNQFHPGSATGDAVTHCMLLIRDRLRALGYRSDIFVAHRDPALADELHLADDLPDRADQVLVVHHSLGYRALDALLQHPAPKLLYYHNITPPEWLPPGSAVQALSVLGREQLSALQYAVVAALAPSEYSALELRRRGFPRARSCNLLFDAATLPGRGARRIADPEAPCTVLFIGRVIESKAQADLIDAFAQFRARLGRPSRLVLVGRTDSPGEYAMRLRERIEAHGLWEDVIVTGALTDAGLAEQYRAADLYVSLSQHEGFGVPLMEAIAYGIPVLAWACGGVPYVLGEGGGLLHDRAPEAVAARMLEVATEGSARDRLVSGQHAGMERFTLNRQWPVMQEALGLAGAATPAGDEARSALSLNAFFTITGHTVGSYSLAAVNRNLAACIEAERPGQVRLLPIEGPAGAQALPATLRQVAEQSAATGPNVVISQHYPVHVPPEPGDLTLALVFWEESLVPAPTIDTLSHAFDAVLAPSRFVAKALLDSGLRRPVRVVGQAPDLSAFAVMAQARRTRPATKVFTFLHVSSCFPRKGADAALAAYARAFRASDPVRLVIKTFPNPHNDIADQVAALRTSDPDLGAIEVIDHDLDEPALLALYETADAMVLPTRGEGLNLPAAEALASGLPLIVTGFGGHMDFCDAGCARLLAYRLAPSGSHLRSGHSLWAEPDPDDLVLALRDVERARRDPISAADLAARTQRGQAQVMRLLDRKSFVRRLTRTAVELLLTPPHAPARVAWVTSWGARCGVAEYARHLIGALPASEDVAGHWVLADDRATPGTIDHPTAPLNVAACWREGQTDDFEQLRRAVAHADPDVVVVQHQPGLLPWRSLPELLGPAVMGRRPVVITLHNTRDIPDLDDTTRDAVVLALAAVARIVVHTLADLQRLQALGLARNVALFSHGVALPPHGLAPSPEGVDAGDAPLIGCYGFFLPGKGIGELIQAVALLRATRPGARLRLVNADYGVAASRDEIARCRALATAAGMDGAIDWETRFLSDPESRALLSACDVIAIPTQASHEASSAAVRTALTAGRPVITTPLPLFDDVAEAVFRTAGATPPEIAAGLDALLASPALREARLGHARTWLEANAWTAVAARFQGMLVGLAAGEPGLLDKF